MDTENVLMIPGQSPGRWLCGGYGTYGLMGVGEALEVVLPVYPIAGVLTLLRTASSAGGLVVAATQPGRLS